MQNLSLFEHALKSERSLRDYPYVQLRMHGLHCSLIVFAQTNNHAEIPETLCQARSCIVAS